MPFNVLYKLCLFQESECLRVLVSANFQIEIYNAGSS